MVNVLATVTYYYTEGARTEGTKLERPAIVSNDIGSLHSKYESGEEDMSYID